MKEKIYFHFTLGPVQGFVAQARRTRDFWAGSFLLSWLSAVAMKATMDQRGEILFPKANQNFLDFVEGKQEKGKEPQQGSIPSRFKAVVNADFKPENVAQAVQQAWEALANFVWQEDIVPAFGDDNSTLEKPGKIWDRQILRFWEMVWVITDDINDSSALDRRKNWRSWYLPDEPGVKCSVMGNLQELSGTEKPKRGELDKFWETLRGKGGKGIENDFSEKESVCAITYVKRRFSRYFADFDTKDHGDQWKQSWHLQGWKVPSGVPSVSYMAAIHWLENALEKVDESLLDNFSQQANKLTGNYGEWQSNITCLKDKGNKYFRSLDGNVFYKNNLENPNMFPGKDQEKKKLLQLLKEIDDFDGMESVSPFYAILMMDGDSLGNHMSDTNKHDDITNGLEAFTNKVQDSVVKHNGFLIYAGGDDVLAIIPLEDALPCAMALRTDYMHCFEGKIKTTLSGAIEFVHVKTPLTKILKDTHQLLDDIAKDQTGRDAIAIRVWKPGGLQLQWSQPWDIALQNEVNDKTWLQQLTEEFIENDNSDDQFSNKFLHKIREHFDLLNPEEAEDLFDEETTLSIMAMEYIQSGKTKISDIKNGKERMNKAKEAVRPLIDQCRPSIRETGKDLKQWKRLSLQPDAALLIRFLAQKGVER